MTIKLPGFEIPFYIETPKGRLVIRVCDAAGKTFDPFAPQALSSVAYGARFLERTDNYLLLTEFAEDERALRSQHRQGIKLREYVDMQSRWQEMFVALRDVPGAMIEI